MIMRTFLTAAILFTTSFPVSALELTVTPAEPPEGIQKQPVSFDVPVPYLRLVFNGELPKLSPEPMIELGDGDPDLSVRAWLMATMDSLYLYADVTDDVFEQTFWGDDLWQGDSIQIAIDPLHNRTAGHYGYDDHEIGLTLSEKRPLVWHSVAPREIDRGVIDEAELSVSREGNHTIYELRLPYASVEYLCPAVFPYAGFTLAVNDSDKRGDRDGSLAWTSGIADTKNPAGFRSLLWPTAEILRNSNSADCAPWIEQEDLFEPVGTPNHFRLAVRSEEAQNVFVSAEVEAETTKTEFLVPSGLSWYDLALATDGEDSAKLTVRIDFMDEPVGQFTLYRYRER
jgi:hypothetical protein